MEQGNCTSTKGKLGSRVGLILIAGFIIAIDQYTKSLVRSNLALFEMRRFNQFWDWTFSYNTGAAFGFLANQNGWQKIFFGCIAILVAAGIIYYIFKGVYSCVAGIGFSFVLGGALGNLVDRVLFGKVTDFICWHIGHHYWPAFNLADSFVCVGVTLLIIDSIILKNGS